MLCNHLCSITNCKEVLSEKGRVAKRRKLLLTNTNISKNEQESYQYVDSSLLSNLNGALDAVPKTSMTKRNSKL